MSIRPFSFWSTVTQALAAIGIDDATSDLRSDADAMLVRLESEMYAACLYEFVKAAWHVVEPDKPFTDNWHIKTLCEKLETVAAGTCKRLIINVPPGTAKSLIINVFFPGWVWAKSAKKRFLSASYGQHLSMRDNLRTRQLVESGWYQQHWPVSLSEEQSAKGRYNTTSGGWRVATSVGGLGTGEHPHFILIDDPTSAQQAESVADRETANEWFDRTIASRLGLNPAIIVIMQRLHKDDLSGHLLKRGGWHHICWPMRYEKCTCKPNAVLGTDDVCPLHKADPDWHADPLDPRTEAGELLFPELFPIEKVLDLELNLGAYGAAGQLQQRPSPLGGKLFKREWFHFVDVAPDMLNMRLARGWDTAATENGGDATASIKIGELWETRITPALGDKPAKKSYESTGRFYLMDPISEHFGPAGVDALIKGTAERDGKTVAQREEREGGSAGKTVIDARAKTLKGYNYAGVGISGNKATRAKPFRAQAEAGNVYLVGTPQQWEPYLKELADFPTGEHDDYVDATSCAFNSVLLEEPPRRRSLNWV